MAYIYKSQKYQVASGTTDTHAMPTHTTGDLLVNCVHKSGYGTATADGWTIVDAVKSQSTTCQVSIWWKIATSSSETFTLTSGTSGLWNDYAYVIKDFDTNNPIDSFNFVGATSDADYDVNAPGATTNTDNCLLIYGMGQNQVSSYTTPPGFHFLESTTYGTGSSAIGSVAAWSVKGASGAAPSMRITMTNNYAYTAYCIAIRNSSGGIVPPYLENTSATSTGEILTGLNTTSALSNVTPNKTLAFSPSLQSPSLTFSNTTTLAAQVNSGINSQNSCVSQYGLTANGTMYTFAAAKDLSTSFIVGLLKPPNLNVVSGFLSKCGDGGGCFVAACDSSNNYRTYAVAGADQTPRIDGWVQFSLNPNQTTTAGGVSGTLNTSAVTRIMLLNYYVYSNPSTFYWNELHAVKKFTIVGGRTSYPLNNTRLAEMGTSFRVPVIEKSGAAGFLSYIPLQFGGSSTSYVKLNNGVLQFPRIYSPDDKEVNYHGEANNIGVLIKATANDTMDFQNFVFTSPSEYYWSIDANSSSSATYKFTGTSVVGAYVTLKPVTTFSGMVFNSCTQIDASSCTLSKCTISGVPTANDKFVTNSSTSISGGTIDVSNVTAGNRFCSVASPSIFTNCTFTGGGGHAIRITTPGTYTITGNTFTGFGANGSTGAAILNDSGGTVVLNVSGGTTPTYKNGTGASTTVNNSLPITLTNVVVGSQYAIYLNSDSSELANGTAAASTVSLSSTVTGAVTIRVRKTGYEEYSTGGTIDSNGLSVYVSQKADATA